MLTKSQLWATLLLVSTFTAGAVVGGGAMSLWDRRQPQQEARRPDNRPGSGRGFSGTLKRELNLSPVQHDSVKSILRRYDPAFRAVMEGTRPAFDSLRAQVHADIRKVLTEEQQDGFTRWVARQDSVTAGRRELERNRNAEKKEKDRVR